MGDIQQNPNSDIIIDTPSKLRAPRVISNPSNVKNTAQPNVPRAKINSAAVISPGGRTLRKRKLESSDESIDLKEDNVPITSTVKQPNKKMAVSSVLTNSASTTIKSNSLVRTTSALAKPKISGNNPPNPPSATSRKYNYSARPGWDTKVTIYFYNRVVWKIWKKYFMIS
jgi:hypothetical protein